MSPSNSNLQSSLFYYDDEKTMVFGLLALSFRTLIFVLFFSELFIVSKVCRRKIKRKTDT